LAGREQHRVARGCRRWGGRRYRLGDGGRVVRRAIAGGAVIADVIERARARHGHALSPAPVMARTVDEGPGAPVHSSQPAYVTAAVGSTSTPFAASASRADAIPASVAVRTVPPLSET